MVRVTDARMSGTSFGTVFLHVAPEAAVGGAIGLVRDGDMIHVDADGGVIELEVADDELARRAAVSDASPWRHSVATPSCTGTTWAKPQMDATLTSWFNRAASRRSALSPL